MLRSTRVRIAAAVLLPWVGCATPKLHPYELEEAETGAPGVETVLLLPLNLLVEMPGELYGGSERVTRHIRSHLDACGVRVVGLGVGEARDLWNEAAGSDGGARDGAERVAHYARHLHAKRPFDALIVPSLVYRDARIRSMGDYAEWDGVKRTLEKSGYVTMHASVHVQPEIWGKMPGVSLHLAVYRPDGARVFDSFGGLDLVHEVDMGTPGRVDLDERVPLPTWEWRLEREPLSDEGALREGVALAFTPWLDLPAPPAGEGVAP